MSNQVEIGSGRNNYYRRYSEEEIQNSNPHPPLFEDDIADVAERARETVRKVTVPRFPRAGSPADQTLTRRRRGNGVRSNWRAATRSVGTIRCSMMPSRSGVCASSTQSWWPWRWQGCGRAYRPATRGDLSVRINDTNVQFTLDATTQKKDPYRGASIDTRGKSDKLRLQILSWGPGSGVRRSWEDKEKTKLEKHLTEIVVELIVSGERQYREQRQRHYEWMLERKAALIEENRKRKEEAERRERERLAALEQARIDRLLGDAAAFRQATDIRAFVVEVEGRLEEGEVSATL